MELMVTGAGAIGRVEVEDVDALGQDACRQVLEAVLAHLRRQPWSQGATPESWTFWLADAGAPACGEHDIYRQACAFADLHGLVHALVLASAGGPRRRPWADEETPTGAAGACYLAAADTRWIPAYLDYLASCDLDHEVHQYAEMDLIVRTHGWGPATAALAAARLWRLAGQHGDEQFGQWLEEDGLEDYLGSGAGAGAFEAAVRSEFERPGPSDPAPGRNDARARGRYGQDLDYGLECCAGHLDETTLEQIRQQALARWDRLAAAA